MRTERDWLTYIESARGGLLPRIPPLSLPLMNFSKLFVGREQNWPKEVAAIKQPQRKL